MEEDKRRVCMVISVLTLLFLALPVVSANIDIIDVGTSYDMIEHYGYVDYQNTENHNLSGAISVFIDGDIVAEKTLEMPILYIAGFQCSPIKTLEFPLNISEGNHTIVALISSDNITAQSTIRYYAEEWWGQESEDVEESEEVKEDWLKCWGYEE